MQNYNGLGSNLCNLWKLTNARSRSLSPENPTGAKGKGGMATEGVAQEQAWGLGQGWKISPYISIAPQQTYTLADIRESGAIQQIWMTPQGIFRFMILRIYWDEQEQPSGECPLGDFFACLCIDTNQAHAAIDEHRTSGDAINGPVVDQYAAMDRPDRLDLITGYQALLGRSCTKSPGELTIGNKKRLSRNH